MKKNKRNKNKKEDRAKSGIIRNTGKALGIMSLGLMLNGIGHTPAAARPQQQPGDLPHEQIEEEAFEDIVEEIHEETRKEIHDELRQSVQEDQIERIIIGS